MAAMTQTDQALPMATADLEAAMAALPVKKQRLRKSFHRVVACAPPHVKLPFTWDDIDVGAASMRNAASSSLCFLAQLSSLVVSLMNTKTHAHTQPRKKAIGFAQNILPW
ncbi:hypothetical protein CFC21_100864 [Triticum aestivum]|uniref:Uncharacterized protein n=2 Tax=Triticum aestivum TaxID=4565 RepID=A0A3B6RPR2_WHEAT|nr:hypothetical protein CFC21_100864 [Triticum aestivum]